MVAGNYYTSDAERDELSGLPSHDAACATSHVTFRTEGGYDYTPTIPQWQAPHRMLPLYSATGYPSNVMRLSQWDLMMNNQGKIPSPSVFPTSTMVPPAGRGDHTSAFGSSMSRPISYQTSHGMSPVVGRHAQYTNTFHDGRSHGSVDVPVPLTAPAPMTIPEAGVSRTTNLRKRKEQEVRTQTTAPEIRATRGPGFRRILSGDVFVYECECGHVSARKGDMERHRETLEHTQQQRGYKCKCGLQYTRADSLKRHRKDKGH